MTRWLGIVAAMLATLLAAPAIAQGGGVLQQLVGRTFAFRSEVPQTFMVCRFTAVGADVLQSCVLTRPDGKPTAVNVPVPPDTRLFRARGGTTRNIYGTIFEETYDNGPAVLRAGSGAWREVFFFDAAGRLNSVLRKGYGQTPAGEKPEFARTVWIEVRDAQRDLPSAEPRIIDALALEQFQRAEAEVLGTAAVRPSASAPVVVAAAPPAPSPAPVSAPVSAPVVPARPAAVVRQPRVALVIGNGGYRGSLGALVNPANDARLVAAALKGTGFDVELVLDADQRTMKQAISRLGNRAARAGQGTTALFYYAGHGIQSRGTNYLVPVGATLTNEADLELDAVAAEAVLAQLETAGSATNIVILDACRNMPLARATRSGTRGLARMDAPGGSFLAYSTAPGQEAVDGQGTNSPFATAFAAEVGRAGQPIQITFQNVRQAVYQATGRKQTPWESSSLFESFYFTP